MSLWYKCNLNLIQYHSCCSWPLIMPQQTAVHCHEFITPHRHRVKTTRLHTNHWTLHRGQTCSTWAVSLWHNISNSYHSVLTPTWLRPLDRPTLALCSPSNFHLSPSARSFPRENLLTVCSSRKGFKLAVKGSEPSFPSASCITNFTSTHFTSQTFHLFVHLPFWVVIFQDCLIFDHLKFTVSWVCRLFPS